MYPAPYRICKVTYKVNYEIGRGGWVVGELFATRLRIQ